MGTWFSLLSRTRKTLLAMALLLIVLSWWRVLSARYGLTVRVLERDGVPMQFMVPTDAKQRPGVLIAHGFGGSKQLMLGFGYKLAHAGYGVMLLDFDGHASNREPFVRDEGALKSGLDSAYAALLAQPEIDPQRTALLGHSMGSGAALNGGLRLPDRYGATIAISPTAAPVNAEAPRNLLLMAGAWEPQFVENAQELLAAAGGRNNQFEEGRAREMIVVPGAEHILVLFSSAAQDAAVEWLDKSFAYTSAGSYRDSRIFWYGLSLVAWMVLISAAAPLLRNRTAPNKTNKPLVSRSWLGLVWSPFAAAIALAVIERVVDITVVGGLIVGGALGAWFLIMGALWLLAGRWPASLTLRTFLRGIALFLFLWAAVGAMAHFVWLPWLLIPPRLARWPLMALAYLPWLLAAGAAQHRATSRGRLAWWLGQSLLIAAGLIFAVSLVPSLSVLMLVLPILPLLLGLMFIAGGAADDPWAFAIGNALFFGWTMMSYFPLAG